MKLGTPIHPCSRPGAHIHLHKHHDLGDHVIPLKRGLQLHRRVADTAFVKIAEGLRRNNKEVHIPNVIATLDRVEVDAISIRKKLFLWHLGCIDFGKGHWTTFPHVPRQCVAA